MSKDFVLGRGGKISTEKNVIVEIDGDPYSSHGEFQPLEPPPPKTYSMTFFRDDGSVYLSMRKKEESPISSFVPTVEELREQIPGSVGWMEYDYDTMMYKSKDEDGIYYLTSDIEFHVDLSTRISVFYLDTEPEYDEINYIEEIPTDISKFFKDQESSKFLKNNEVFFYHVPTRKLSDREWKYMDLGWSGDDIHKKRSTDGTYNKNKASEWPELLIFYYRGGILEHDEGGHMCFGAYVPKYTNYFFQGYGHCRRLVNLGFYWSDPWTKEKSPKRYLFIIDNTTENYPIGDGLGLVTGRYNDEAANDGQKFSNNGPGLHPLTPYKIVTSKSSSQQYTALRKLIDFYDRGYMYNDIPNLYPENTNPHDCEDKEEKGIVNRHAWGWKSQNRRVMT